VIEVEWSKNDLIFEEGETWETWYVQSRHNIFWNVRVTDTLKKK
jgi:hypothetical protein